jgi:hypothetical protein
MTRAGCGSAVAGLVGFAAGMLLCALITGAQVRQYERGLWTMRFQRLLDCGVDYNGPPYTSGAVNVWLTCGADDRTWQLWPPWEK